MQFLLLRGIAEHIAMPTIATFATAAWSVMSPQVSK